MPRIGGGQVGGTNTGSAGGGGGGGGGVGYAGMALPGTRPVQPRIITNLQTGHGYATNAGGTANLNDTTQYVLGTQSVTMTTDGLGTAKTLKRTAMTAFTAATSHIQAWVKIDDDTHLSAFQIYIGTTNLASYYRWEMKSSAGQKWITTGGWHLVNLSWGEATITGTPDRAALTDVQFRVVDDATAAVTVHINGLALIPVSTAWPNGVVSLTFDDTFGTQYTVARPKMDQYGYPGTAYVIQDYIGASGRMTLAQLHALERYCGWEIAGHATTGAVHAARFTSMTPAQLTVEFAAIREWLRSNGFRGDHLAYPGGEFNDDVLDATEVAFTGSRLTFPRPETLPPARASKIRSGGYATNTTTAATLTTAIDQAYNNREWLVMTWHNLVSPAPTSTDYLPADFNTVIDYLNTRGIPVRTVGEVLRTRP